MTEYSKLTTEGFNKSTENIDKMTAIEIAKVINDEDKKVAFAVERRCLKSQRVLKQWQTA